MRSRRELPLPPATSISQRNMAREGAELHKMAKGLYHASP